MYLVLGVLVAAPQLQDVLEGGEQRLVEVEVWRLRPAAQNLHQQVVEETDGLLGDMALPVTGCLGSEVRGQGELTLAEPPS